MNLIKEKGFNKIISSMIMVVIGTGTAFASLQYGLGSLSRVGPGFFPFSLGILLSFLGLLMFVLPDNSEDLDLDESISLRKIFASHMRAWSAVLVGSAMSIVLGQYAGLVPATFF